MSEPELSRDDVVAMKQQGDLRAYLRAGIRSGAARREARQAPAVAPVPVVRPEGHVPGAWPAGSRPSSLPRVELSRGETEEVLQQFREWAARTSPEERFRSRIPCPCLGCRLLASNAALNRQRTG